MGGIIPEPPATAARGALQLLDAVDEYNASGGGAGGPSGSGAGGNAGAVALPPGFLEDFSVKHAGEMLEQVRGCLRAAYYTVCVVGCLVMCGNAVCFCHVLATRAVKPLGVSAV